METRQGWFKIDTYQGNVTILFIQNRSLHIMCKDLMSEAVITFRIEVQCPSRAICHQYVRERLSR